jgi:hypothetical protein
MLTRPGRLAVRALSLAALFGALEGAPLQAQCSQGQQSTSQLTTSLTGGTSQANLLAALQQQQAALQAALQQINALIAALQQQTGTSTTGTSTSTTLAALTQRQAALQSALQQAGALQTALQQQQTGQVTPAQLQQLVQNQAAARQQLRLAQLRNRR